MDTNDDKSLDQIVDSIAKGLTGDITKDLAYLTQEGKKYQQHPLAKEISRVIGRMLGDILLSTNKEKVEQLTQNELTDIDNTLDEAELEMRKKSFTRAQNLLESTIKRTEGMFQNDSKNIYFHFNNFLEYLLYKNSLSEEEQTDKEIQQVPINYSRLYLLYGTLLFEFERYDEARESLLKGLTYNPISAWNLFELGEIYKVRKNFKVFFEITEKALRFAYEKNTIARAYRNFGYYYIEQEKYDLAIALFSFSLYFEKSMTAKSELMYIMQKKGELEMPKMEVIQKQLESENIPICPETPMIQLIISIVNQAFKEKETETAIYYLHILYDLTADEKILKVIQTLEKDDEDGNDPDNSAE